LVTEYGAADVHGDGRRPNVVGGVEIGAHRHTGVGPVQVEGAESRLRGADTAGDLGRRGLVGDGRERAGGTVGVQRRGHGVQTVFVTVREGDGGAGRVEPAGEGEADTTGGAGDHAVRL
jgi:hypothetical protein